MKFLTDVEPRRSLDREWYMCLLEAQPGNPTTALSGSDDSGAGEARRRYWQSAERRRRAPGQALTEGGRENCSFPEGNKIIATTQA